MKHLVLCVTGPMAAGKNLACSLLEKKGFVSVDADILVHTAIENSKQTILETFGPVAAEKNISLLDENGNINRRALGQIVFTSPELTAKQENIVYPEVDRMIKQFIEENSSKNVIINATVLYKIDSINLMDYILFIDCPGIMRFFRAKKRDGMKTRQILQRFKAQKNLFAKYKNSNADTVRVWNTGSQRRLETRLDRFLSTCR